MYCAYYFREKLRISDLRTDEGGYTPAPPALFPTVAKTSTGPRVAHVARASCTVSSDQEGTAVKTEPSATCEIAPLVQHTLPTSSVGRSTRRVRRIRCVDPSCPATFTRPQNMRRHAIQFHKLKGVGVPATEAEHEAAVLAAAQRSNWIRRDAISYARRRRVFFQRPVKTEIQRLVEEEHPSTGPRLANVARTSSTVTSYPGATFEDGPTKLTPLPGHTLPTSSVGRNTRRVRRIRCVDPSCLAMFTRLQNMRRHAIQFHKLKGVGVPATEAEHEAAVLAAAERSNWIRRDAINYARRRRVRFQRPVKTEIQRLVEVRRLGEQPAPVDPDPQDHPDVLSSSAWAADVHRTFGCQEIQGPCKEEEWTTEQRPEERAPTSYLHQLLRDKPTLPVQGIVDSEILQHGWADDVACDARLTVDHLEAGRQQILDDIRALVPETVDEHSALTFTLLVKQYLAQFPHRPE